ncbi:hypothetical protein GCM10007977_110280 [Dactylosporangium sucinum]|uniref:Carrier domain-containing protein n=1 Tax=Dactylosporangium sucinum TaxID=1424081 RepID=A0A917UFY8_9ACTN|nr:hypothetical protein GCM10007977_110280 [Dactylosporangium sucinum]
MVAVRARALRELAGTGAMASVAASAERVQGWLAEGISIAAVNGPESVVVSGPPEAVHAWAATLEVPTRVLDVDYASHGPMVEAIEAALREQLADVRPREALLGWYSTVFERWMAGTEADGGYWYTNLREQVRFAPVVEALVAEGYTAFVEASGHPVLAVGIVDVVPAVTGTLRRDEPERRQFLAAAGALHTAGVTVDWPKLLGGAGRPVDLPTYAFERTRYWIDRSGPERGLLDAAVALAGGQGCVLTGRLSLTAQPWLAEHVVGGVVMVPGAALVELAVRAGDEAGCGTIRELTPYEPLLVPEQGTVQLQVTVGGAGEDGGRRVGVYSRPDGSDGDWIRHAEGILAPASDEAPPSPDGPVADAVAVSVDAAYELLAEAGLAYGPAFRGLLEVRRAGDDVYAEVALPPEVADRATTFGIHPILLDLTVQAWLAAGGLADGAAQVPVAWSGVRLWSTGADRLTVRVRALPGGALGIVASDADGRAVVTVGALTLGPAPIDQARRQGERQLRDARFTFGWAPVQPGTSDASGPWTLAGADPYGLGGLVNALGGDGPAVTVCCPAPGDDTTDPAERARQASAAALGAIQDWLAADRDDDARMVVVTRNAVAAVPGDGVADVGAAAVWGLVRCAQAEQPDAFILLDLDDGPVPVAALALAATGDEPQLAVREGQILGARLTRGTDAAMDEASWDEAGTVLVTGGTGGLGRHLVRHLATRHGVRHLLLLSRSGPTAPGAAELTEELAGLGATAEIVACDASDRAALATVLAAIPETRPLRGIVHAAGALDDGVLELLTPERFDTTLRPKANAAWHLHVLTAGLPLTAFVLFSSAAGVFGAMGQANYAAANAFLDALAAHRHALGLPANSMAWGMWAERTGLTKHMAEVDLQRVRRSTSTALSTEDGLALFDASLLAPDPVAVLFPLQLATIRAQTAATGAPAFLRALLPGGARRAAAASSTGRTDPAGRTGLAQRLQPLAPADRDRLLIELVGAEASAVLGHSGAGAIAPGQPFKELGFDSLTAVELRNRLNTLTGLRLPTTTVFDYPNLTELAAYLRGRLVRSDETDVAAVLGEIEKMAAVLGTAKLAAVDRVRITTGLQALFTGWTSGETAAAPAFDDIDIDSATDDELFNLADETFGRS